MKTALLLEPKKIVFKKVDIPKPGENEVLVKIKACGVCPTDVKKYIGSSPPPKYPFILGHEVSGIIEELGKNVNKNVFKIGDRVVLENIITCETCRNCKNGNTAVHGVISCSNYEVFGVTIDGGFREYAPVTTKIVHKMPDHMTFNEAALVEPVACCLNGIEKAEINVSDTVLILGAGFMGLVQLELAKLKGARVIISDIIDERLEVAKLLGADLTINPLKVDLHKKLIEFNNGELADVVMCSVGGKVVTTQGIEALNSSGRLVIIGGKYPKENVEIDPNEIHYKQAKIIGSVSYTKAGFVQTIQLIADKKISTKVLQSELVSLEKVEKAFKDVLNAKGLRKCVVFD